MDFQIWAASQPCNNFWVKTEQFDKSGACTVQFLSNFMQLETLSNDNEI